MPSVCCGPSSTIASTTLVAGAVTMTKKLRACMHRGNEQSKSIPERDVESGLGPRTRCVKAGPVLDFNPHQSVQVSRSVECSEHSPVHAKRTPARDRLQLQHGHFYIWVSSQMLLVTKFRLLR